MHLIGQKVCFHSAMKHENDLIGCLQAVRIYSFMKEINTYMFRISSFSLLSRKIYKNFIKEIQHVFLAFIAW